MAEEIKFFISAIDKSSGAFRSVNGSIGSLIKTSLKATAVVAGTGASLLAFTKVVANSDDKVGKFANRIGVAVEGLSQYQFVANQAGISTEQFNMATQRMTRRVSEAAKGTGEAVSALRELGINAKTFQNLPLDQRMQTLAKQMEGVTNESDKLRLAFKLFDSEGTAMLQMLNQGSDAMREAAADAKFLGLVVDKEAAAKAELFNYSLGRMTGAMKGVSRGIAGELMPIFSGLANTVADSLARNRQNIVNFVKNSITNFFTFVEVIKQAFSTIKKVFSDPKAFQTFLDNLLQIPPKVLAASIAIGKFLIKGIYHGIVAAKDLFVGFGEWIGESFAQIVLGQSVTPVAEKMADVFVRAFQKAKDGAVVEMEELKGVMGVILPDIGSSLADTFSVNLDEARKKAEEVINSLSLFAESTQESVVETAEVTNEFMELFREQQNIFMDELRNNSMEFVETLRTSATNTIDNISEAVGSAIVAGESLQKSFRAIAKNVLKEIISALIKMGIQRLILAKLNIGSNQAEASAEASRSIAAAGSNMFASWAGAPWPISLGAPAAAAAAVAGATAAYSAGAAAGKGAATIVAHGGLTNNPNEQTAILAAGERVISPRQNRDLTSALDEGRVGGGGVTVNELNIAIHPNDSLADMSTEDLQELIAPAIIGALNDLDRNGITPNFVDRNE